MNHDSKESNGAVSSPKPYEEPRIEWEEHLDLRTLAVACNKQEGNIAVPGCDVSPGS